MSIKVILEALRVYMGCIWGVEMMGTPLGHYDIRVRVRDCWLDFRVSLVVTVWDEP